MFVLSYPVKFPYLQNKQKWTTVFTCQIIYNKNQCSHYCYIIPGYIKLPHIFLTSQPHSCQCIQLGS